MTTSSPKNPKTVGGRAEPVQVAILDLYDGESNQGMRALRTHLTSVDGRYHDRPVRVDEFDVRQNNALPRLDYDIYISSGGPGSPFVGEGTTWDARYFEWLAALWEHNQAVSPKDRKHALFICYSFQLLARHFDFGTVTERASRSFGIVPIFKSASGHDDPLLRTLPNPFWGADFRGWQVVRPDEERLQTLGGAVIAREDSPKTEEGGSKNGGNDERAVMGVRLSPEVVGLQFHPEADPEGMLAHFRKPERRRMVVEQYGSAKYDRLLRRLDEMDALGQTQKTIIPTFLRRAVAGSLAPSST